MTAPIVQRLRETAAALSEERVTMQTLAHAYRAAAYGTLLLLMAGPCLLRCREWARCSASGWRL